jgi:hypothetical protein
MNQAIPFIFNTVKSEDGDASMNGLINMRTQCNNKYIQMEFKINKNGHIIRPQNPQDFEGGLKNLCARTNTIML